MIPKVAVTAYRSLTGDGQRPWSIPMMRRQREHIDSVPRDLRQHAAFYMQEEPVVLGGELALTCIRNPPLPNLRTLTSRAPPSTSWPTLTRSVAYPQQRGMSSSPLDIPSHKLRRMDVRSVRWQHRIERHPTMYPPIPTRYRGRWFRSRLEARWALAFDALGYRWVYEPERVTALPYLPDFFLPDFGVHVEVKWGPMIPERQEPHDELIERLADFDRDHERWQAFVEASGTDLWVSVGELVRWIEGVPSRPAWTLVYRAPEGRRRWHTWTEGDHGVVIPTGSPYQWNIGPAMRQVGLAVRSFDFSQEEAA